MLTRFILAALLSGASALLTAQPASAHRLRAAHLGGHQGVVHMHAAGHPVPGAHPHR